MKNPQIVPFLLTNFSQFLKWYFLLATKLSPLKPPGGYEKRGLNLSGFRGVAPSYIKYDKISDIIVLCLSDIKIRLFLYPYLAHTL